MSGQQFILNLGGEGEVPDVINQQPPSALGQNWLSQQGQTVVELANTGLACLICENDALPFPDGTVDVVYTNNVPIWECKSRRFGVS